ncbi:hypothetical protein AC249_AIPGENE10631, partial [Exaiptasia diaphana]
LIIAGALGIAAWPKQNRGLMVGFLVMCIIACILASIQAIVSGIAYALWFAFTSDAKCRASGSGCVGGLLAFIILSVLGALFTLAGSIIGCVVSCGSTQ